ncbi:molybdate ABC transporter substrate-binding protein [Thalassobaculum sp.]|uniref:molybdate ABC transporter substrate-binding protein n=1 Tax=Thalassobaculum sp. TaxID=2022740 RepID=UPI0032EF043E
MVRRLVALRRRTCVAAIALAALAGLAPLAARAGEVHVAVAANFTEAAKEIVGRFEAASGHRAILSFGSTGQLYAQISHAAPFEVFLAADPVRPRMAVEAGLAVPGSQVTYATGRIVLFSPDRALVTGEATLRDGRFARLAIANPATAPYGAAAVEVLQALGVHETLRERLVQGNNIAQAYQFVATGNAELGFVALSQVVGHDRGSRWIVPFELYRPIAQDAVLLRPGAGNTAAVAFMAFLQGPEARAVNRKYGYGAGD